MPASTLILHLLQNPNCFEIQRYLGMMSGVSLFHLRLQTGICTTLTRSMRHLLSNTRFERSLTLLCEAQQPGEPPEERTCCPELTGTPAGSPSPARSPAGEGLLTAAPLQTEVPKAGFPSF